VDEKWKKAIERLKKLRAELDATIAELQAEGQQKNGVSWERLRALRVLKAVDDAGGSIPRKELNAKAIEFGYPSPSALGGWYEGKRQGSLRAEGDMAVLTDGGKKWLNDHRDELDQ
jgi:hypothetical protein